MRKHPRVGRSVINVCLVLTPLLGIAGGSDSLRAPYDRSLDPVGLEFEKSVPRYQIDALKADLRYFGRMNLEKNRVGEIVLGVDQWAKADLQLWLRERISVVVGESFDVKERVFISWLFQSYPKAVASSERSREFFVGDAEAVKNTSENQKKLSTQMSHVAGGVYRTGRANGQLLGLRFDHGNMVIRSPRSGVVQIESGMFESFEPDETKLVFLVRRLRRLATLFHEGRHSDGNGKNAGFPHLHCPEGHDYAGRNVCDDSRNGSYAVSREMYQSFVESCRDCSLGQIEYLRLIAADSANRIVGNTVFRSTTPEYVE